MAARRRLPEVNSSSSSSTSEASPPKLIRQPEFDTCNFYVENVNLAFDPKRVLLRRLFFLNEDRNAYVSVRFYPIRDYQTYVEFGFVMKNGSTIRILVVRQVTKMAECLPTICESMCDNKQYGCKEGDFRMNTTGSYRTARIYLDRQYISLKLVDLQCLSRMFYVVQNQLNAYTVSLPDVLAYLNVALTSINYVESTPSASKLISYTQLFEELKMPL